MTTKPNRKNYRGEAYSDAKANSFIGNIFFEPETSNYRIYPIHPDGGLLDPLPQEFKGSDFIRLADLRLSASKSAKRFQVKS